MPPSKSSNPVTLGNANESILIYSKNASTSAIEKIATSAPVQIGLASAPAELHVTGRLSVNSTNISIASGKTYSIPDNTTIINVTSTGSPGNVQIILPASPRQGQMLIIKDYMGNASNINIVISGASGRQIDGNPTKTISSDYGSLQLTWQGDSWTIITSSGGGGGEPGAQGATIINFGGLFSSPTQQAYYLYPGGAYSLVTTSTVNFAVPVTGTISAAYVVNSGGTPSTETITYVVTNTTHAGSATIATSKSLNDTTVTSATSLTLAVTAGDILTVKGTRINSGGAPSTNVYSAITLKIT
jgi:hypothetical protein